jgi:hypothetical protein
MCWINSSWIIMSTFSHLFSNLDSCPVCFHPNFRNFPQFKNISISNCFYLSTHEWNIFASLSINSSRIIFNGASQHLLCISLSLFLYLPCSPVIFYYCELFSLINVDLHKSFPLKHHNIYFHHNTNSLFLFFFSPLSLSLLARPCLPKIHYIHCHIFLLLSGW